MIWLSAALLRWVALSALALVTGALALETIVLPVEPIALDASRGRLRRWVVAGVLLLMVTTVGQLMVRAQVMTGGSLSTAIRALPLVLGRTHFGAIWIGRGALLVAALVAGALPARAARWSALALVCGVATTTSLTGHGGDWGDATPTVAIDLVHIVAASAWTGGLMALVLAIPIDAARWPPDLFPQVAHRFSRLAGWCLAGVSASGIYNAVVHVATPAALVRTPYGGILLLKILLFLGLAGLGAISRYGIVAALTPAGATGFGVRLFRRTLPRLANLGNRPASVVLSRYVACEALVALLVFGCTAVLGEVTPARHAFRMQHQGTMRDGDGASRQATPHGHEEQR
jgi:copper transport protein